MITKEVWSFIEVADKGLDRTAGKIATEATRLGRILGELGCGIIASNESCTSVDELGSFGLRKLYHVNAENLVAWTPEAYAEAVASVVSKHAPHLLLFAATSLGKEVAARVAARLDRGLISDCVDFACGGESVIARRVVYGGKAHMNATWSTGPPYIATVEVESLEAIKLKGESPETIEERVTLDELRCEVLSRWNADPRELDLGEARLVVGVGRPITVRASELEALRQAAEACGAAFGVSRPVVDAGLLTKDRQIGASGKWLNADVYIACGISGSSYHMLGVRQVRHLVAVNTDPGAPILKQAELSIVADLFEVLPALGQLAERKQNGKS